MKKNSPNSMGHWNTKASIKLNIEEDISIKMELGETIYEERFDRWQLYEACKKNPFWLFERIIAIDQSIERRNAKLEKAK